MVTSEYSLESLSHFLEEARSRYEPDAEGSQQAAQLHEQQREEELLYRNVPQDRPTHIRLSLEMDAAWQNATRMFRSGEKVKGIVAGWNRGGLLVRWDRLQGFVPTSQLNEIPVFEDEDSRDEKLARWVGEELDLRIIELDRSRNRLVFSERAAAWGPKDGERLLAEITADEIRRGQVSNLCAFGAFVDLGGIDGLIHISELSWGRITHPRDLLTIGQEVQVYVLGIDRNNHRIALSLKQLRPNPWATVEQRFYVGQISHATITNVVDFGAFAKIEEGLEGLIHISELCDAPVNHPSQVVHLGDQVLIRILHIDSANHRLGLSMRQVSEHRPSNDQEHPLEAEWGVTPGLSY